MTTSKIIALCDTSALKEFPFTVQKILKRLFVIII